MLKRDLQTPPRPRTRRARFCDGIDRRDALTLGGTGLLGGLSLPGLLRLETEAAAVEAAVAGVLDAGHRTPDIAAGGPSIGSREMGQRVLEAVAG